MPRFSELKQSNYLTKADCGRGILLTIRGYAQENVAMEGEKPDMKFVLSFNESEKGMVLNSTNGQIIASIIGSDDMDHAIGKKIVLYEDPNISFQGRLVGGIRVRAPRPQPTPAPQTQPRPVQAPRQATPAPAPVQQQAPPPPEQQWQEPPPDDLDVPFNQPDAIPAYQHHNFQQWKSPEQP